VNSTGGKQYALVSFHIVSKLVQSWTWATFEHKDNPGRCDVLGCKDNFGPVDAYVAPLSSVESQTHYPDCAADFVWSVPFCAIDDTAQPPETKSRFCSSK
jgi:hypothetical protein